MIQKFAKSIVLGGLVVTSLSYGSFKANAADNSGFINVFVNLTSKHNHTDNHQVIQRVATATLLR